MRYLSLFAQIAEHQFCETVILIAFRDLSRRYTKRLLWKRESLHWAFCACTIIVACTPVIYDVNVNVPTMTIVVQVVVYIYIYVYVLRITYYVYMYMYIYSKMSRLGASGIIFVPLSCCGSLCRTRGSQAW